MAAMYFHASALLVDMSLRLWLCASLLVFTGATALAQPANDECTGATFLGDITQYCSAVGEFSNNNATTSPQPRASCQPDSTQRDVWVSFVATATNVSIRMLGSLPRDGGGSISQPQFSLYSGTSCSGLTEIACISDAFNANVVEAVGSELTAGEVYFLRLAAREARSGTFQLCIESFDFVPEPQSDCIDGVLLCNKDPFTVTQLVGAGAVTNEVDRSSCVREEFSSVWYKWTCKDAGDIGFVLTPNSPIDDLDFVVYELPGGIDDCAGKQVVRCMASGENISAPLRDWERCSGKTGLRSSESDREEQPGCGRGDNNFVSSFTMVPGRSYALLVNNFSRSGNGFSIEWTGTGTFVGPEARFAVDPDAGGQCDITDFTFTNLSSTTPGAVNTYQWFFGGFASQQQITGEGPHLITYGSFGRKTITLRLTSSDGCVVSAARDIFIEACCDASEPLQAGEAEVADPTCPGTATGSFSVPILSGEPQYFFSVDGGPYLGDSEVSGVAAGDYRVFIQNIKGCTDTVDVTLDDPPGIEVEIGPNQNVTFGGSFVVRPEVSVPGNFQYVWSGVDSIECLDPACSEVRIVATTPGELQLDLTSELGCTALDRLLIEVRKERPLYAPTAFSPNGDLVNDNWTLYAPDVARRIQSLRIFDRWGELVFEGTDLPLNDQSRGWDGRFREREPNPGVYAYVAVVEYIDGVLQQVTGDINLIR